MTFTHALSTNNYGPAKFIVDASAADGTHTTIAAAITSASSGETIFIRPGTYTENLTLAVGINLTSYQSESSFNGTGNVIINGTCTLATAGTVSISGIQLQTNSAALLAVTGTVASVVNLFNCHLNCSDTTGITLSSSSATSGINIFNCSGDIGTTGIALFAASGAGALTITGSCFSNSGATTTASTISSGTATFFNSFFKNPVTTSSTASINFQGILIDTSAENATALTVGGSGASATTCSNYNGGTASSISISSSLTSSFISVSSSNTNAITGAGTHVTYGTMMTGSSLTSDVTTQTGGVATGLRNAIAPAAGFVGEKIESVLAEASAVTLTTVTAANITSISLTAGVWDVSALGILNGNITGTAWTTSISTVSATEGTQGDNLTATPTVSTGSANTSLVVPSYRLTLSSTTTVYLVVLCVFSVGTAKGYGRISATRVG